MVSLGRLFQFKRFKSILSSVLILTIIVTFFHSSNKKLNEQFNWVSQLRLSNKIILPTTSHSYNNNNNNNVLNLKTFQFNSSDARYLHKPNYLIDLREQLSLHFPYDPSKQIPRHIWQTWKYGSDSPQLSSVYRAYQNQWNSQHNWHHSLVRDEEMIPFLNNFYGDVPLVVEAFKAMPNIILKADFFRYLVLYARGGIYTDMDTFPLKDLDSWPSVNKNFINSVVKSNTDKSNNYNLPYKNKDMQVEGNDLSPFGWNEPGFVVGIEADPDRPDWSDWYARRIQFCQWTIQSKPGHPILRELILNITATTLLSLEETASLSKYKDLIDSNYQRDYNVNYRDKRLFDESYNHEALKNSDNIDGTDIMNWTGPGIFSDIIFEYMNNLINTNNNIVLQNPNLGNIGENNENEVTKSTKKFYKKVMESLQSFNAISWEFFSLITKPVVVDDIMILPITCFSPGVNAMEAKDDTDEMAFVKHMFSGSWKATADKNAKKN